MNLAPSGGQKFTQQKEKRTMGMTMTVEIRVLKFKESARFGDRYVAKTIRGSCAELPQIIEKLHRQSQNWQTKLSWWRRSAYLGIEIEHAGWARFIGMNDRGLWGTPDEIVAKALMLREGGGYGVYRAE